MSSLGNQMLKINRQTDYAVRVILALSKKPQGTRISTSEIGREMLIPPALLQRIVAELANGGFINTQAGRDGGIFHQVEKSNSVDCIAGQVF